MTSSRRSSISFSRTGTKLMQFMKLAMLTTPRPKAAALRVVRFTGLQSNFRRRRERPEGVF
jgi:hypothetical protein